MKFHIDEKSLLYQKKKNVFRLILFCIQCWLIKIGYFRIFQKARFYFTIKLCQNGISFVFFKVIVVYIAIYMNVCTDFLAHNSLKFKQAQQVINSVGAVKTKNCTFAIKNFPRVNTLSWSFNKWCILIPPKAARAL